MTVITLLILIAALLAAQRRCAALARRQTHRMMRPADEWDESDVDRWLDLIETFPLPERRRAR